MIDAKLRNWVIGIVTGVWALNFVAGLVPQLDYKPDPAINAVFMGIVGGVLALGDRNKRRELQERERERDEEERPS